MTTRTFRICAFAACATLGFAAACEHERSPTTPTAPSVGTHVVGWVVDPILRPVAGAAVRVLDGPLTGTRTDTDANGRFELRGTQFGPVKIEVSREGFKPALSTATWTTSNGGAQIRLESLEGKEMALDPGDYTVKFSFNLASARNAGGTLPACAGFPSDLATRTFNATVTETPSPDRADRVVTLQGPTVFANEQLWLAIGPRSVSFGEMENPFTEQLPGFRYLNAQFGPLVPDESVTVSDRTISVPATGFFQYCELFGPIDMHRGESCQYNATKEFHVCRSDDVRLVFTKR